MNIFFLGIGHDGYKNSCSDFENVDLPWQQTLLKEVLAKNYRTNVVSKHTVCTYMI
jgi:hypothetical protein